MLPHAKIVMLEGIGHTPQVEAPDVLDAIEDSRSTSHSMRVSMRQRDAGA